LQTIGYARPSWHAADLKEQVAALTRAGCCDVVVDHGRGRHPRDLKKRVALLNRLQPDDTLVVSRLECIAVSGKDLLTTLSLLIERKIHLQILHDNLHGARDGFKETLSAITTAFAILSTAVASEDGDVRIAGRSAILRPEDWERIQADAKVMSAAAVARQHNVSRSTLYNYLKRMEKQSEHAG
jgi:DNA invertase Pin-like site-specific DNA recombinase